MNSSLHDKRFRRKNPRTSIPETAFPEPYMLTETENTIIDGILEALNTHGLTSHQSMNLPHFHKHSRKGNPEAKTGGVRFRSSKIYPP
jgi:hypothetical protein